MRRFFAILSFAVLPVAATALELPDFPTTPAYWLQSPIAYNTTTTAFAKQGVTVFWQWQPEWCRDYTADEINGAAASTATKYIYLYALKDRAAFATTWNAMIQQVRYMMLTAVWRALGSEVTDETARRDADAAIHNTRIALLNKWRTFLSDRATSLSKETMP